jgi:hypothetical protein
MIKIKTFKFSFKIAYKRLKIDALRSASPKSSDLEKWHDLEKINSMLENLLFGCEIQRSCSLERASKLKR